MNELLRQIFKANRNIMIVAISAVGVAIYHEKRIKKLEKEIRDLKSEKGD